MKRALLASCLFLAACRGGDDTTTGDDGPDADDVAIYDVQGSMPVDGTVFNVRGVVVTSIDDYGERVGDITVQEPDGGAFSGVKVYGIELGTVSDLAVGDLIDLEGVTKDEFALSDDTSGRTTTELSPPEGGVIQVTVIDQVSVPAPEPVDALAIGMMASADDRDAEWEKWEGVLIELSSVSVLQELDQIGSTPQTPPFEEILVTGPIAVDTSLAAIDAVTRDDCLSSVVGIGDYFFDWKVLPRDTADIVGGGSGCPAQEADSTSCGDGEDNEADGFADCDDFSCQVLSECVSTATVAEVQGGTATGTVTLNDVFITALTADGKHLWVADALQGDINNGVYVYRGPAATVLDGTYVLGAQVDVTGDVEEFDLNGSTGDTLTELTFANVGTATGSGTPVGAAVTAVQVGGIAATNGEAYEGVLVTLTSVKAMTHTTGDRVTLQDASSTVVMDDDIYNYTQSTDFPDGNCYTITGIMSISLNDDERRFLPRSSDDVAAATGCI